MLHSGFISLMIFVQQVDVERHSALFTGTLLSSTSIFKTALFYDIQVSLLVIFIFSTNFIYYFCILP